MKYTNIRGPNKKLTDQDISKRCGNCKVYLVYPPQKSRFEIIKHITITPSNRLAVLFLPLLFIKIITRITPCIIPNNIR